MQEPSPQIAPSLISVSAAAIIGFMLWMGFLGGAPLQLLVQTAPLWAIAVIGWRGAGYVRWAAAPMLGFWALLSALVWADRLGWARLMNISMSNQEAHLVLFAGVAGAIGLAACFGRQPRVSPLNGLTLALACGALQIGAYYLGMQQMLAS